MTSFVRVVAAFGILFASSFAAHAVTGGATWIDAGKTFLLGGEQKAAFNVEGSNTGPVPVEIYSQSRENSADRKLIMTLAPGRKFALAIEPGQIAAFKNAAPRQRAKLKLKLTEDVSRLSMRYEESASAQAVK